MDFDHRKATTTLNELRWAMPWHMACGLFAGLVLLFIAWLDSSNPLNGWLAWTPEDSHWSFHNDNGALNVVRSGRPNQNVFGYSFGRTFWSGGSKSTKFAIPKISFGDRGVGQGYDEIVIPYWLLVVLYLVAIAGYVTARIALLRRQMSAGPGES